MEQPLRWFAWATVAAVTVAAVLWIATTPFPSYWDEAAYYDHAVLDARAIHAHGISGFLQALKDDRVRPPAYRLLAAPLTSVAGPSLLVMRLLSWSAFLLTVLFVSLALRRVAGTASASLGAALLIASPILVLALKMFGTEYPLLLAIAALLYFEFGSNSDKRWIGSGIAIGLGLLAKTSFLVVAVPLLIGIAIVSPRRRELAWAVLLGVIIALPWWISHGAAALSFGMSSRTFAPHALGPPASLKTFGRIVAMIARCVTGLGVFATVTIVLLRTRRANAFSVIAIASALPLLIGWYSGGNHNPRLIAPALLLLLAGVAALAGPLLESRVSAALCILLVVAQTFALVFLHPDQPTRSYIFRGVTEVMAPIDQWDLTRVKRFAEQRIGRISGVAVMGLAHQMNPPQIAAAWLRDGAPFVYTRPVWKDTNAADAAAAAIGANVILTAPGFKGDPLDGQPAINRHNAEFAQLIGSDRRYQGFAVDVGVNERAVVAVFLRRDAHRP